MIDYSIIIDCPDEYLDILNVFFIFCEKNWPTRKSKIFITSQNDEIKAPNNVEFVKCGKGLNSIQRTKEALKLIKTKYILIIDCDDIISKKVDDKSIDDMLIYAEKNKLSYIQVWSLKNREQRKYKTGFKGLYYCNKKARYSRSLMANFWDVEEFLNVFSSDTDDGWTVEGKWLKEAQTETIGHYDNYCYYDLDPFNIVHAVSKGKWIRKAYRFFVKNKIEKDLLAKRDKLSLKLTIKYNVGMFFYRHISSKTYLRFKKIFKKFVKTTTDY
ncbi:MAG: hypothetical protein IJQ72_04820 [Bacilli bacterium]|nr:hypothetical protein [Bacilli bacterium]